MQKKMAAALAAAMMGCASLAGAQDSAPAATPAEAPAPATSEAPAQAPAPAPAPAPSAPAKSSKAPGSGPNPFVDCGIGAALFPRTHWAAVTSNVIWDIGTTAVTSATASPQTCSGKSTEVAKFVLDAYENVVEETARGAGTHVATMLEIYGCDAGSREAIVAAVRPELGAAVGAPGYAGMSRVQKAEQYYLIVTGEIEKNFAASCAV